MISRDVTFFEKEFPCCKESTQDGVIQPDNAIIREESEEIEELNDAEIERSEDVERQNNEIAKSIGWV